MKNLFLFLVSLSFTLAAWSGEDISHFRDNFAKIKDYKSAELFLDTEVTESNYQYAVTINSYKAVCKMMMAQYVYNPFSKYSWFNEGKDMLEKTISLNKNVENVYLRLVVQLNVPSFLSYTTDIESDVKFILDNLEKSSVPDNTKTYILKSLA
ncbi:MAG: hypothetical protein ABF258_09640, partial [Flavobacteriales bacterium]